MKCLETVWELVGIVRSGQLVEQRAKALRLLGETLICAADLMQTAPMAASSPESIPDSAGACADWLHEHVAAPGDTPEFAEAVAANPLVWLVVQRLIKLLIDELL